MIFRIFAILSNIFRYQMIGNYALTTCISRIYYFAWCGDTLTSDDEEKRKKHPAHDCVNVGDIGLHRVAGARGGYGPRGPAALQLRGVSEPGLPNTIEIRTNLCGTKQRRGASERPDPRFVWPVSNTTSSLTRWTWYS